MEGFLRYEFGAGGLYLEGLIFRILRYLILVNLQAVEGGKKCSFRPQILLVTVLDTNASPLAQDQ